MAHEAVSKRKKLNRRGHKVNSQRAQSGYNPEFTLCALCEISAHFAVKIPFETDSATDFFIKANGVTHNL